MPDHDAGTKRTHPAPSGAPLVGRVARAAVLSLVVAGLLSEEAAIPEAEAADPSTISCTDTAKLCANQRAQQEFFCGPTNVACQAPPATAPVAPKPHGCSIGMADTTPTPSSTALSCPCPTDRPNCLGDGLCHSDFFLEITGSGTLAAFTQTFTAPATTCGTGTLTADLGDNPFHLTGYDGQTFHWKSTGTDVKISSDDGTDVYVGVAPDLVDGAEILPDDGVALTSSDAASAGSGLTAKGVLGCATSVHDAGAPTTDAGAGGNDASSTTCAQLAVTSLSPSSGPLGTTVTLSGHGFACLKSIDFRTFSDIYTFKPSDLTVVDDATLRLLIPSKDDGGANLETGVAPCEARFTLLSTDPLQSTVTSSTFTITGAPGC